ncbi:phospholipid scramblase 2 isoform X5 [Alexandromys fortis]|uniref:phospholipid scramblase 2 isoform X5 n=1 Tax=Alexandromys fortis TaxID=100897 RepID=UPI002152C9D6|nr:phospholipid scramblase 2 isoform X5 [Microtus fortis]XP_050013210.1 phospholipid scramblase 2 isoform X5 [Microtus fortis]XP_050013211.1 phospholipid scramblase 2 isoform X5 [Microtus fortis]
MPMEAPRPGTHLPAGYVPQYPPAAFQGPSAHTGHPVALQTGYQGPQPAYPGPQLGYTVATAGSGGYNATQLPSQRSQAIILVNTQWMPAPPPLQNCPPGLEYLSQIDQILIHQQTELLEVLTGFETNNKFEIKNSLGQMVYLAVEDTDCCTRNCCEAARPFTLRILDNLGQEVMTLERPLRCSSCCFPCCLQEIEIQAPPGVPIGYVTQNWHPCLPKLTLQNEKKENVLKVVGPCVACTCCTDIDFEIRSLDEQSRIGKISKQWSGCVKEAFTDSDNFGIQFPLDLDVKMKAVTLGACFLLDYMFFEGCE